MATAVLLLLLAIPVAFLAIADSRRLVYFVLLIAGIPVTMFLPGPLPLGPFGELAPQAAYLLVLSLGLLAVALVAGSALGSVIRHFPIFLLFLLYATASIGWSLDSVEGLRLQVKLLAPLLIMIAVVHSFRGPQDVAIAEKLTVFCAFFVAALAVANQLTGGALGQGRTHWIAEGVLTAPYMSPANFSFFMNVAALICLARFMSTGSKASLLCAALFGLGVLLAFTRISMAALVVGSAAIVFLLARSAFVRFAVPAALIVGSVATIFFSEAIQSRMFFSGHRFDLGLAVGNPGQFLSGIDTSGRLLLWKTALDYFETASRWLGAGLGSSDSWLVHHGAANALHSEYLRLYIDTGIVGLSLFLAGMLQVLMFLGRESSKLGRAVGERSHNAALGAALLLCFLVTLLTDNSLNYVTEFGLYVFAGQGYAVAAGRFIRDEWLPSSSAAA